MNNFKKLGLTALASSLAAVSAHAGEMSVTGSLGATYVTNDGDAGAISDTWDLSGAVPNHGSAIGHDKDFTVNGSGELDNGWTFSGYTLMTDGIALSSSYLSMTMGSMGTIATGHNFGGAGTKYDGQTPVAYEEVDDGGAISMSSNRVGASMDNNALQYTSPSFDIGMGMTATVDLEWSPNATGGSTGDGGHIVRGTYGSGRSLGVMLAGSGLTVGVYGSERENVTTIVAGADAVRDEFSGVWFANYSIGPVSIGYSESYYDDGVAGTETDTVTYRYAGANDNGGIFETEQYSVAFNVNDNLSISYAKAEDTYDAQSNVKGGTETADVTMDLKSIQVAYSMGAMSIKAYRTETDNVAYNSLGGSVTVNEIALGLAF